MNFKKLINSFKFGDVSITRYAIGSWSNGQYTAGTTSEVVITAAIFPSLGEQSESNQLLRLPEGQRTRDTIRVFTYDPIYTTSAPNGRKADLVPYQGDNYEIKNLKIWDTDLYDAIGTKVGQ